MADTEPGGMENPGATRHGSYSGDNQPGRDEETHNCCDLFAAHSIFPLRRTTIPVPEKACACAHRRLGLNSLTILARGLAIPTSIPRRREEGKWRDLLLVPRLLPDATKNSGRDAECRTGTPLTQIPRQR